MTMETFMETTRLIGSVMLGALAAGVAAADQTPTAAGPIRICAARNDLPYSDAGRHGFENKIAQVVAAEMRRPLEFVWTEKDAIYLVRDYLDRGLCDVVMGLDTGDPRVLTTRPYYRSGYVFIYRQDRGLNVQDWNSPDLRKLHRFAIIPGTPAETMLKSIGKFEGNFHYMHSLVEFKSRRNQYVRFDPERLVREVEDGKAEIAVLWGPVAARYVKQSTVPLKIALIPDHSVRADGEKVGHHYDQSFGVRKDDVTLLRQLDQVLESAATEITAILKAEGMPLLPLRAAVNAARMAHPIRMGEPLTTTTRQDQ
ncbi:MAG: methanol oxidation system protein MoxJ [Pseudomonadota bacterium]|nr:methanol oxidation system protein MoxJ [Pseudomonadota bacterium]